MSTSFSRDLESYNRFILHIQDRAYTLAVHLRGKDDPLAETIVQDVFREYFDLWKRSNPGGSINETRLLGLLLQRCRRSGPVLGPPEFNKSFNALTCDEKMALILVDCIECSCQEAAQVLAWPIPQLRRVLASARLKIAPLLPRQVAA